MRMALPEDGIKYLVGRHSRAIDSRPLPPYDSLVCGFLSDLSSALLSDKLAKAYPDVVAFAYWCRKGNIERLKTEFVSADLRLGLGLVFHITPSNVPINFAFSYVFSLLAGNANIVRVPTKGFAQTGIVCEAIDRLCCEPRYQTIAAMTTFVRYEQSDDLTARFSAECNARIIWGGDGTITRIREFPIPPRSIDVTLGDRYSLCVIDAIALLQAPDATVQRLAKSFYNDSYLMDQNACSSPHLIVWLRAGNILQKAKDRFWEALHAVVRSTYELQPIHAMDKYVLMCENVIDLETVKRVRIYGNYLYRVELSSLWENMDVCRGKCGYFYEYDVEDLDCVARVVNSRYQTLTYFGVDTRELADFVLRNRLSGIDRIVPVGTALDIGTKWDGYDIVRSLSRVIDVR